MNAEAHDPYSNSKACSELITAAYRSSFFNTSKKGYRHCAIATARAGNVIGGGDWATDRIIPDCFRAILSNAPIIVRNPQAIRPWQHVLEPLSGYLLLGKKLFEEGFQYAESWNFGPDDADAKKVEWVVKKLCEAWGHDARYKIRVNENSPHEATFLKLDCSKSKAILKWYPRWNIVKALEQTILWTKAYKNNEDIVKLMQTQIEEYCGQ